MRLSVFVVFFLVLTLCNIQLYLGYREWFGAGNVHETVRLAAKFKCISSSIQSVVTGCLLGSLVTIDMQTATIIQRAETRLMILAWCFASTLVNVAILCVELPETRSVIEHRKRKAKQTAVVAGLTILMELFAAVLWLR